MPDYTLPFPSPNEAIPCSPLQKLSLIRYALEKPGFWQKPGFYSMI